MFKRLLILLLITSLVTLNGCNNKKIKNPKLIENEVEEINEVEEEVLIYNEVNVQEDGDSYLCTPAGEGPFPGVLYNHGGKGNAIGGDLEGTCRALAEAGYIAYSKQRSLTLEITKHPADVLEGLEALKSMNNIDEDNIAIMGFSRGGLLALTLAIESPELFNAIILMAPALGGETGIYDVMEDVSSISAPVLILVSENDLYQADHLSICNDLKDALEDANKEVELIVYPPYGDDGHELFFEVGNYWDDVLEFLEETM